MNTQVTDLSFLSPEPFSLRAIDQTWVNHRAAQLGSPEEPDISGALTEVAQTLYERIGDNVKDEGEPVVFMPGNETDPYVIGIPLDQRRARLKREGKAPPVALVPDNKEMSLREEFEDLLFQEGSFDPSILDRADNDRYVVPWVNARWEGFQMYHRRLTLVSTDKFKAKYNRTLGRYVLGKVAINGSVLFTKTPFRHQTKAQALEEANRLSTEFSAPFALFRCLDIVDAD